MSALDDLRAACAAPLPHPDAAEMDHLGRQALAWVVHHLATLSERPVGHAASPAELEGLVTVDRRARWYLDRWWPGPLTLVLPEGAGTRGVRVPDRGRGRCAGADDGRPLRRAAKFRSCGRAENFF